MIPSFLDQFIFIISNEQHTESQIKLPNKILGIYVGHEEQSIKLHNSIHLPHNHKENSQVTSSAET